MNTLATVYCCAGEVKMCMAAVKGENNQWKICFENQANFFLQIIQVFLFFKLAPVKG